MRKLSAFIALLLSLVACTSSPLDRLQVVLYSDAEMAERGIRSYREMQAKIPATADARELQYVKCVANYVVAALDSEDQSRFDWEVTVFDNEQANTNLAARQRERVSLFVVEYRDLPIETGLVFAI